jgi:hypothetical protein
MFDSWLIVGSLTANGKYSGQGTNSAIHKNYTDMSEEWNNLGNDR